MTSEVRFAWWRRGGVAAWWRRGRVAAAWPRGGGVAATWDAPSALALPPAGKPDISRYATLVAEDDAAERSRPGMGYIHAGKGRTASPSEVIERYRQLLRNG